MRGLHAPEVRHETRVSGVDVEPVAEPVPERLRVRSRERPPAGAGVPSPAGPASPLADHAARGAAVDEAPERDGDLLLRVDARRGRDRAPRPGRRRDRAPLRGGGGGGGGGHARDVGGGAMIVPAGVPRARRGRGKNRRLPARWLRPRRERPPRRRERGRAGAPASLRGGTSYQRAAARITRALRPALEEVSVARDHEGELARVGRRSSILPRGAHGGRANALGLVAIEPAEEVGGESQALVDVAQVGGGRVDRGVAAATGGARVDARDDGATRAQRRISSRTSRACSDRRDPAAKAGSSTAKTASGGRAAGATASALRCIERKATQPHRADQRRVDRERGQPGPSGAERRELPRHSTRAHHAPQACARSPLRATPSGARSPASQMLSGREGPPEALGARRCRPSRVGGDLHQGGPPEPPPRASRCGRRRRARKACRAWAPARGTDCRSRRGCGRAEPRPPPRAPTPRS